MSTEIEKNQDLILQYLYRVDFESNGKASVKGDDIREATNLKPLEINDAVLLLQDAGLVKVFAAMGTAPYKFHSLNITPRGKLEIQKEDRPEKVTTRAEDPRKIFVVYGRNLKARKALFAFLRSIDLHPFEWSEIIAATGEGAPYIGNILDKAFSQAQAVVVLMTPDDEGRLRDPFRKSDDPPHETNLTPQARLNVLFEAGMAMGRFPNRTILVELGALRPFSDIGGRHIIKLNDTTQRDKNSHSVLKMLGVQLIFQARTGRKQGTLRDH